MKAEIVSIGSEITSGQNLDTNSHWLSRRLAESGIPVHFHTTVADNLDDNVEVFRRASERADLVLTSGGLGPTQDDLTREALARAAGVELVFHDELLETIRAMFAARGRVMVERNRVQAYLPVGAEAIPNDRGTAPGVWMKLNRAWVAAMPGVPTEMFAMYEDRVKPKLLALGLSSGVLIQRKINCFGAGESVVEEKLLDLTRRGHVPEVGITVSDAVISLRILARAATTPEAMVQIAPVEATIRERLAELVYGEEAEEIEDAVVRLLNAKRVTLGTAESVTCGQVAQRLGRVSGVSAWYKGGIVAYTNEVKENVLGVPRELIERHGAVSSECAAAMATGCRERLGVDYAISTTGLAGPGGGTAEKPVGLVYVGLAGPSGATTTHFSWSGTRTEVQGRAARLALNTIRLRLLENH